MQGQHVGQVETCGRGLQRDQRGHQGAGTGQQHKGGGNLRHGKPAEPPAGEDTETASVDVPEPPPPDELAAWRGASQRYHERMTELHGDTATFVSMRQAEERAKASA